MPDVTLVDCFVFAYGCAEAGILACGESCSRMDSSFALSTINFSRTQRKQQTMMAEAPGARKSPPKSPTGKGSSPPKQATHLADALDAAHQAETTIQARDEDSSEDLFSDAGYSSDSGSVRSYSISSSVRDYEFEHGRRYNSFREGRYNFPNDDLEQER
jgi:hypothetical protein